ncbi:MAG: hypothetical protein WBR15_07090 [Gammaproteobacteria bacterium]
MKKHTLTLVVAVALLLITPLSFAGNADQEISTATTHAKMGTAAGDMPTAIMHLHHVINCLVGPNSKSFDAKVGDPCQGMGDGALNDIGHAPAAHIKLERALTMAERALHANSLDAARQDAARIAEVLEAAGPSE